jgi:hypothetical protein
MAARNLLPNFAVCLHHRFTLSQVADVNSVSGLPVFFSSSFPGFQVFRSITFRVLDDSRRVDRSSTLSNISSVSCNKTLSLSLSLVFAPNLRLVELRSGMPLGCLLDRSLS